MEKRNRIIYWASTGFLAFGMLAQGITQVTRSQGFVDILTQLGYPLYLLTIIGTWKILGVIAVLIPKFPILKEWAYAGFFFVMSGALFSHLAMGSSITETLPSLFLLIVIGVSWYFRPADRKLISVNI
ncbi:DoxX family protein [Flavihumibacter sp. R14]|nr:DoxX family protein [Flavihumibacter soli]